MKLLSGQKGVSAGDGKERGAAMLEFAVVVPLLLLFIGAAIDFASLLYETHKLAEAAYAGSSAAAQLAGSSDITITNSYKVRAAINVATQRYLSSAGLDLNNYDWKIESSPITAFPNSVKVTVGRNTNKFHGFFAAIGSVRSCSSSVSMLADGNRSEKRDPPSGLLGC